jgi:hypothetical protein
MKILFRLCVVIFLATTLTGVVESKVKTRNFGKSPQTTASVAIDPSGFLHVAYMDVHHSLYHARFDGRTWLRELIDTNQYYENSMAIDSLGRIHILYGAERYNGSTWTYPLVHAYFNGTSWQVTDLPVSGHHPSVVLDADDHPHVLFNFSSQYGVFDGTNWEFEATGVSGGWASDGLALDADGHAHISYSANYLGCFYASNKSGTWESTMLVSNTSAATAIGVDNNGRPHVVTGAEGTLVYHSYDGTNWTNEPMVDFNDADPRIQASIESTIAMAMDANGRARIMVPVYLTTGNAYAEISVFVYDDGAGWNGLLVDKKNTGLYPSIALDTNGVAYVTYCGLLRNDRNTTTKWARIALSDLTGTWTNVSVTGATVTGMLNVTNQGLEKSAKTIASLWLSDDATLTTNDTSLLVSVNIKPLKPGASVAVPVKVTYSGALTGKYLFAVIDPNAVTADRNFLDNLVPVLLAP